MRNILTNHRVDLDRVIDWAIQTCLEDPKACLSMSANKWVGGLSKVKNASDLWSFWYICDPKTKWYNWQTVWYRTTSTVYDQYWSRWRYDETGTRQETATNSQWGYSSGWWTIAGDFWIRDTSWWICYLPKWEERWRQSYYYDWSKWSIFFCWIWDKWKTLWLLHTHSEQWRQPSFCIYPLNTTSGSWWVYQLWSSVCRIATNKVYETDNVIRIYRRSSWNWADEDYRWGWFDIDKKTWQPGEVTGMTRADIEAFQAAHPNGYYSDLDNMTLLINYEEYSWWAYFAWKKVWESWYFQRWRDNKAMEYIYRPVNLVQE